MARHIEVLALMVIVFGLLAFSKVSDLRFVPEVRAAGIRIQNANTRINPCPIVRALFPRFK